eukprot:3870787-Alexandrium_andersonii.AAC.1
MSLVGSTAKAAARGSTAVGLGSSGRCALASGGGGAAGGWFPGITASIAFRSHWPQERPVWPTAPVR